MICIYNYLLLVLGVWLILIMDRLSFQNKIISKEDLNKKHVVINACV